MAGLLDKPIQARLLAYRTYDGHDLTELLRAVRNILERWFKPTTTAVDEEALAMLTAIALRRRGEDRHRRRARATRRRRLCDSSFARRGSAA
eukprot:SAG22_NODE_4000_length_1430_cov_1.697971_2_plen_91_part_01